MRRFGAARGAALLLFALALCTAGPARAAPQIFSILDFQFEDGSVLPDLHIAYETRGTLAHVALGHGGSFSGVLVRSGPRVRPHPAC